jgi:polyphenol oxidase
LSRPAVLPALPAGVRLVEELPQAGEPPLARHPGWLARHDWLVHGVTMRGAGEPVDMGLFGGTSVGGAQRRWRALRAATGMPRAVHARQVHGARVLRHAAGEAGLFVADAADGHLTADTGVLLTISVADCVPIYLVAPARRIVGMLHAGWRGVAAGMLEEGLRRLHAGWQLTPGELELHLGPAICGACYEVGREVLEGVGLDGDAESARADAPAHVDLRATLARRAVTAGVDAGRLSVSALCTRCDGRFFSHRGGDAERQVAFIGVRPPRD